MIGIDFGEAHRVGVKSKMHPAVKSGEQFKWPRAEDPFYANSKAIAYYEVRSFSWDLQD